MAKTVSTVVVRNGRSVQIVKTLDSGDTREAHETIADSAEEWRACAYPAARDALTRAMTRENAARTGAREGRKIAREYLGKIDARTLLAGVLSGE